MLLHLAHINEYCQLKYLERMFSRHRAYSKDYLCSHLRHFLHHRMSAHVSTAHTGATVAGQLSVQVQNDSHFINYCMVPLWHWPVTSTWHASGPGSITTCVSLVNRRVTLYSWYQSHLNLGCKRTTEDDKHLAVTRTLTIIQNNWTNSIFSSSSIICREILISYKQT